MLYKYLLAQRLRPLSLLDRRLYIHRHAISLSGDNLLSSMNIL